MKIEKHNAHGMQLLVEMKPLEALSFAVKLIESAQKAGRIGGSTNFYFSTPCVFEDDNDRWVQTSFDVVVTSSLDHDNDLEATYPCGKEIVQGGMNSAPEFCNMQKGHEDGCYRR